MSDLADEASLTAYERWELPLLEGTSAASLQRTAKNRNIVLPTAAELEDIHRQAHDEGYQAGYVAGSAEGAQRVNALLNTLQDALKRIDQDVSQDLLDLALTIAQQMVQQTLRVHPEVLQSVVREAIAGLPYFNQGAHLCLHPEDASMLRASMGEQLAHGNWKILEDTTLTRGSLRLETSHSQVDATLENRWQRIMSAIGQDKSWIQE